MKKTVSAKVAFNTVYSSVAKVCWTLISLVAIGFITRYLGIDGFGQYTTVLAFFFLFSSIGDLGLNQIVLREISKYKEAEKEQRIISTAFTLKLAVSLILIILTWFFIWFLPYSDLIKKGIFISSFGLFFSLGYQVLVSIFQKRLLAHWVATAELLGRVSNLIWVFLSIKFEKGLLWIIGGMIASWVTTFIIIFFLARRKIKFGIRINFLESKNLIKDALPLGISAIVTFIYFRIDTIILSVAKGVTEVGIYGAAYKIVENVSYFPAMFMGLVMPILAKSIFIENKEFKKITKKIFDAVSFIAIGISFGIFALAPKIILIIAGEGFEGSIIVLRILAFAILGIFFAQYFNTLLIVFNQQKKLLMVFVVAAVFNIVLNFIFIPSYSYIAAGIISSLTEIIVPIMSLILVIKNCNYIPLLGSFYKLIVSGLLMVGFIMFFPEIPIYLQIILGGGIYSGTAYLLGAFSKEDFKKVINLN